MPRKYICPDAKRLIFHFWQGASGFWPALPGWCAWFPIALLIAAVLLQLPSGSAVGEDKKPDECGLASIYSGVSEETASGEDTRTENLTAAHRSLPLCGRLRAVKGLITSQRWSEQPCVRPIGAAHRAAGHNALRGSGPGQKLAFNDALAHVGCPDHRIDRFCITCCRPFPAITPRLLARISSVVASPSTGKREGFGFSAQLFSSRHVYWQDVRWRRSENMGWFSWLFGDTGDNRRRNDRKQDAGRKLSPAMPMAGAGAELDGERDESETEKALERAVRNK